MFEPIIAWVRTQTGIRAVAREIATAWGYVYPVEKAEEVREMVAFLLSKMSKGSATE